jgi:GPI mannosyltransferase 1 subunit X
VLLVQDIPSSVYVDNDQLFNLNKLNKLKTFVPSYIDVELPTSKSEPFKVFMFNQIRKSVNMTLPVHFRYHDPSDKKFNRVEIESPKIFMSSSCPITKQSRIESLPCQNSTEITGEHKLNFDEMNSHGNYCRLHRSLIRISLQLDRD